MKTERSIGFESDEARFGGVIVEDENVVNIVKRGLKLHPEMRNGTIGLDDKIAIIKQWADLPDGPEKDTIAILFTESNFAVKALAKLLARDPSAKLTKEASMEIPNRGKKSH